MAKVTRKPAASVAPTATTNGMPQPPTKKLAGQADTNLIEIGHTAINRKAMAREGRVSPGTSLYLFLKEHAAIASELISWLGTDYMQTLITWHVDNEVSTADGERSSSEFDSIIWHMEQDCLRSDEGELKAQQSYKISMLKKTS